MKALATHLMKTRTKNFPIAEEVLCADGYTVSIQAAPFHYCSPKRYFYDVTKYTHLELGFPSCTDELLDFYADDTDNLLDTVYGRVPVDVVLALIEKHGGLV